jgi:TolB protein
LRRLTSNAAGTGAWSAAWSPDGNLISYVSNRDGNGEVYVMRPDGTGQTNLTKSPSGEFNGPVGNPPMAFSPDGKRIAFLSDRHGNSELFSINTDGTGLQRMTNDPGDETSPRWTEDGRCLTFYSSRPSPAGGLSLYVVDADGTALAQLATTR